jgi:hypothetical protein
MSFNINDVQDYLQNLDENLNNLKKSKDLLTFSKNIVNIEKITSLLKEKYCNVNLFDKYIKKEIFSNILSFLPKKYVITKRSICKKWYDTLTCNFIQKSLGPFNEPYRILFVSHSKIQLKYITKISNKICNYYYISGTINVLNDNGSVMETYKISNETRGFFGNSTTMCYFDGKMILRKFNGEIITKLNIQHYFDVTMDDNYIYVLGSEKIFQYNVGGQFIKSWNLNSDIDPILGYKIIVDKDEIFVFKVGYNCIKIYSNNGKLIREIGDNLTYCMPSFDIYKDHIYILDVKHNLIKVFSRYGKLVTSKEFVCEELTNLFVINDKIHIITEKEFIYELKFF